MHKMNDRTPFAGGPDPLVDGLDLRSYQDWLVFVERLKKLIATGRLRKIPALKVKPQIDEEWYVEEKTGNIFFYRIPEDRPTAEWKKVEPFAPPEPESPSRNVLDLDLTSLPFGRMSRSEALSLLTRLFIMRGFGKIEVVPCPNAAAVGDPSETWVKDLKSGTVFRLIEGNGEDDSLWEPVRQSELYKKMQ